MLRNMFHALAIGSLMLAVSACNTVRGVGDDLKSAANEVDNKI